jgi:hypothetical protein
VRDDPARGRPNVFLGSLLPNEEDRFTAHWHYLLDAHPELGQAVVDLLVERAGLPPSRFVGAEDHPFFTSVDRPNFLLLCEGYRILCEHKLDAELGPAQLERYCALVPNEGRDGKAFVMLVAKDPLPVPGAVIATRNYLRPSAGLVPHFRWEDFFPIVSRYAQGGEGRRLVGDFVAYMTALGLDPWVWVVGVTRSRSRPLKRSFGSCGRPSCPTTGGADVW